MSTQPAEDRAAPGEEHNPGPPTPPRQAATVILLRGGAQELELLLVKRTAAARFMGGVWVFPGGAVEHAADRRHAARQTTSDGEDDGAHRAAAVRELREEAGITLPDAGALVKFSRWITPAEVKIRFDTHFFLAELPPGEEACVDGNECVAHGWFTPAGALAANRAEQILLVFPTIKQLEQLSVFGSAAELLEYARGRTVEPVQPRVVLDGEIARVLLPGDPGY